MHTCAMSAHYLHHLLAPRSFAVIGASEREGALGRFVLENMRSNAFQSVDKGILNAAKPKYRTVLGDKCYRSVGDLTTTLDLIVVTLPANTVAGNLSDTGAIGA